MVVAQLTEWSLPLPQDASSNPSFAISTGHLFTDNCKVWAVVVVSVTVSEIAGKC